ncbi:hypothetical protein AUJ73_02235 [Candidatus Gottesmanbacteria bacterium CG1_02_37_22]|uniref:Uncharacterized protein n=1 Tax=Candidatus Gottesmanbacteria bacterium CG1_02_37_22 TaxID=1805209 RepID=A0A1J4TQG0_9BACT|nr:MAG: hypothetical protein AUJ73_02235 [Candidatus Gottesmanbacteria bacterium CG1_02_37_22]
MTEKPEKIIQHIFYILTENTKYLNKQEISTNINITEYLLNVSKDIFFAPSRKYAPYLFAFFYHFTVECINNYDENFKIRSLSDKNIILLPLFPDTFCPHSGKLRAF